MNKPDTGAARGANKPEPAAAPGASAKKPEPAAAAASNKRDLGAARGANKPDTAAPAVTTKSDTAKPDTAALRVRASSPLAAQKLGATATPAPVTATPSPSPAAAAARPAPAVIATPAPARAAAPQPSPAPEPDDPFSDEEEQTRIADTSALAGAFSAAVSQHPAHVVSDPLSMPGDEWFVGINGVPVGPIRLSELRSKAGSGSITKESLVWRDGFEEWRPLKSFPELVAIVEESLSSARSSIAPMAPAPNPLRPPGSGVEPLSDPFAGTVPLPVGSTPSGAVTGAAVVVTDDLEAAGLRRRRGTSPAVWVAMIVAVLFGLTLGFVFFSRQTPEVRIVEVPAKAPAPVAANSAAVVVPEAPEEEKDAKGATRGPLTSTKTTAKSEESKLTGGLKGLGLSGLSAGPKGPSSTGGPSSAGGQLDQAQIQPVVGRYTSSVKRSCWQPALDTRDKDAPGSARVSVSITIGPSGAVQNVSTSGDPRGYRGLANCIAGRVRGWQFPPSSGSTTVNVPFVFVAQ